MLMLAQDPLRPVEDYVVTLGIDFADDKLPGRVIHELCRGDPDQCMAVMRRLSTPSDDRRPIEHWWLQFGPVVDWENFILAS